MSDLIAALASSAAHACQYGRTVTLTADPDAQPCQGWANQLVTITTDDGQHNFCFCVEHKTVVSQLTRAEEITVVVAEVAL